MQVAAVHFDFVAFDQQICIHQHRLQIFDAEFSGDGAHATEAADLAHHFVEDRGDDATVNEPDAALVFRAEAEGAADLVRGVVLFERKLHAACVCAAAAEADVFRIGFEQHRRSNFTATKSRSLTSFGMTALKSY